VAPLVSVIVPAFNHAPYVRAALDSIFVQAHRPLEVIVVDDGSTDETASALDAYAGRVILLRQANAGPARARNAALSHARGEFLAFLDADDLWHPEKLARQLARFARQPRLEVSVCRVENFWDGDPAEETARLAERDHTKVMDGVVMQALVARRGLFERVGGFDPQFRFGEDTDWYVRAGERGAISEYWPEVLGYRRVHERNMTRIWPEVRLDTMLQVAKAAIDRHRGRARSPAFPAVPLPARGLES
jgi:glycosyltransferase involved in cell wall biosynthesis